MRTGSKAGNSIPVESTPQEYIEFSSSKAVATIKFFYVTKASVRVFSRAVMRRVSTGIARFYELEVLFCELLY
jgi:hypothetical protein